MVRWADYLVSAVKYDNHRIVQVMQHKDVDEKIGDGEPVGRDVLTSNLKKGMTYMTIFNGKSNWTVGDHMRLIKVGGEHIIRTDSNKVKRDNLKYVLEME